MSWSPLYRRSEAYHNVKKATPNGQPKFTFAGQGPNAPRLLPGAEFSTWIPRALCPAGWQRVHIVGVGFDPYGPTIRQALATQRQRLADQAYDAAMPPGRAIALIRQGGGVAILAHPHRNVPDHDPAKLLPFFRSLKEAGLDGVEVYRADLPAAVRSRYVHAARQVGLFLAGGSDFHEDHHDGRPSHPGDGPTTMALWHEVRKRIEARGGVTSILDLKDPPAERRPDK